MTTEQEPVSLLNLMLYYSVITELISTRGTLLTCQFILSCETLKPSSNHKLVQLVLSVSLCVSVERLSKHGSTATVQDLVWKLQVC